MTQLFSNNAATTTVLDSTNVTTDISVADGSLFSTPSGGDYELLTIHDITYTNWEIVKLVGRTGNDLVVQRNFEGVQQPWPSGSYIAANITAKTMEDIVSAAAALTLDVQQNTQDIADAGVGGASGGKDMAVGHFKLHGLPANLPPDLATNLYEGSYVYYVLGNALLHHGLEPYVVDTGGLGSVVDIGTDILDWQVVQILVDGVPQITGSAITDEGTAPCMILGPNLIRFFPLLTGSEIITVIGVRPTWFDYLNDLGYDNRYVATGVSKSYLAGGVRITTTNTIREFSWLTNVTRIMTALVAHTSIAGTGGASTSSGLGYFFGGSSLSTAVTELNMSADSSLVRTPLSHTTQYGDTFTDTSYAWLCGYGITDTDTDIGKYDLTTFASTTVGSAMSFSYSQYLTTMCDGVTGYIFGKDTSGFNAAEAKLQKLTCASDTLTTLVSIGVGANIASAAKALLFNDGVCYLWTSADPGIIQWDTATDTILYQSVGYAINPLYWYTHSSVCDGEYQAQSEASAFLKHTVAVTVHRSMLLDDSYTWLDATGDPVGAITDNWSQC